MTSVALIYPFFKPRRDRSVFRFPPLGISYVAASLHKEGHSVRLIDCTFLDRAGALKNVLETKVDVIGIYCMVSMVDDCMWFARNLRDHCHLLVAGGPLPSCEPRQFLDHFDVVVRGEGEQTMIELLRAYELQKDLKFLPGIAFVNRADGAPKATFTDERPFSADLDAIPFPAREMLPNKSYIDYGKKKYGFSVTTVMSTRGCPFCCEFCSNVVFGGSYRERSARNVVDEIEQALSLGYDRISFSDDVFTLKKERVRAICEEIIRRGLCFKWECLGRVDALDDEMAAIMKKAGCTRIFFGVESGNDRILSLMKKQITTDQARRAVEAAHRAGLQAGAFFILFYPGDTDETVLQTLRFAASLPLDYLGLTMPYPLPGTPLYKRVSAKITRQWRPD
jgi:anaerobic magnesium-protoporphyrin IX monomethyl ester cyclase